MGEKERRLRCMLLLSRGWVCSVYAVLNQTEADLAPTLFCEFLGHVAKWVAAHIGEGRISSPGLTEGQ